MNIWQWVRDIDHQYREEHPLVTWMRFDLPGWVLDHRHEEVDAMMPQALALARELKEPWLEVFVRHWHLQSIILQRCDIRQGLPAAVELLERSHREDMRECPQTTCVSQDVCVAYGCADGPGYAKERLAVCEETLSRINARWACWECISNEYADALNDQGRYQEAIDFIDGQRKALRDAGEDDDIGVFRGNLVESLIGLGRVEEALELNTKAKDRSRRTSFLLSKRLDQAHLLCLVGRHEEAAQIFPEWGEIERSQGDYVAWCLVARLLTQGEHWPGQEHPLARMIEAYQTLFSRGVVRSALSIAGWAVEGAIELGLLSFAAQILDEMQPILQELREPLGADEEVAALRQRYEEAHAAQEIELPETEDEFGQWMTEGVTPEQVFAATRKWGGWWQVHEIASELWQQHGFSAQAEALLERYLAVHPDDLDAVQTLSRSFFLKRDRERFDALLTPLVEDGDDDAFVCARWCQATWAEREGNRREAISLLQEAFARRPGHEGTQMRLSELLVEEERLEEALEMLDTLVASGVAPGTWDWLRMRVATRLEAWPKVRESARRVAFPIDEGDGPIEGNWELVELAFEGTDMTYVGQRTGPVTARVLEIAAPTQPQHYHDLVVFSPRPLNPVDWDALSEQEREDYVYLFAVDAVIAHEQFSTFVLDGVHPGEAAFASLKDRCDLLGVSIQRAGTEGYLLDDPETGEEIDGLYALLAVPADVSLEAVETMLRAFAEEVDVPLVWPALLVALDQEDDDLFDEQLEVAQRHGMRSYWDDSFFPEGEDEMEF